MANCYENMLSFAEMTAMEPIFDCGAPPTQGPFDQDFTIEAGLWAKINRGLYLQGQGWQITDNSWSTSGYANLGTPHQSQGITVTGVRLLIYNLWTVESEEKTIDVCLISQSGHTCTNVVSEPVPISADHTLQEIVFDYNFAQTEAYGVKVKISGRTRPNGASSKTYAILRAIQFSY